MKQTLVFLSTIICLLVLLLWGCNRNKQNKKTITSEETATIPKFILSYPHFNREQLIENMYSEIQNDPSLLLFYENNDYQPIWISDTLKTTLIKQLVTILNDSENHGIPSQYFFKDEISKLCDSIDNGLFSKNGLNTLYNKLISLEKMATKAVLKYGEGMNFGFLNPKDLYKNDYNIQIQRPDSVFYEQFYASVILNPINAAIESQPTDVTYRKIIEKYQLYKKLNDEKAIKITGNEKNKNYKLGDESIIIASIINRLSLTGEYMPDTLKSDSIHLVLDSTLLAAVNRFRISNSYFEDNQIGQFTIDALNRPFSYYMDKLVANMERYRWRRIKQTQPKNIEVNVAAFKLFATSPDTLLQMSVCVGGVKNKTPLLQSDMGYINLNPVWNVPRNITRNEVLVHQQKDPSYLKRHNMKLFKSGKEIDPSTIDWGKINPYTQTFYVRQESGSSNSLGRLKFMFSNPFSVYLHDTPLQSAFNRQNRAVSHGCVRLQKPIDLAFFCVSPSTEIYRDRLLYSIDKKPISTDGKKLLKEEKLKKIPDIINLKDTITLSIDYFTTYMQPMDTTLYFADDIYSYDKIIKTKIDSLVYKNK